MVYFADATTTAITLCSHGGYKCISLTVSHARLAIVLSVKPINSGFAGKLMAPSHVLCITVGEDSQPHTVSMRVSSCLCALACSLSRMLQKSACISCKPLFVTIALCTIWLRQLHCCLSLPDIPDKMFYKHGQTRPASDKPTDMVLQVVVEVQNTSSCAVSSNDRCCAVSHMLSRTQYASHQEQALTTFHLMQSC